MNIYLEKFIRKNFKEPSTALDLGAGELFDVKWLESNGWNVEGVDIKNGINLENYYLSDKHPFKLVYSNYVLNKIDNKATFIKTAYDNLAKNGWLFLHVFDVSDQTTSSGISKLEIKKLLEDHDFKNIKTKILEIYDDQKGHNHFHKILQAIARK